MVKNKKHIDPQTDLSAEFMEMISRSTITWDKTREQVWQELLTRIESPPAETKKVVFSPLMRIALAAVFTLLVGFSVFMQVYVKSVSTPAGQQSSVIFPDNSSVRLNAYSEISYKPLLWKFSRKINFEGEAYFEVQAGKRFEVISERGKTSVLGTNFNIYSRDKEYQVSCISGSVEVMERISGKEVILQAGEKAVLGPGNILEVKPGVNGAQEINWLQSRFSFTSESLDKVFEEIARQYGVVIVFPENTDLVYTGTFKKADSVEKVLKLVCRPFNLEFSRKSEREYVISR